MPVIKGNITGSIATIPFNIPCKVISFFLTNRSSSPAVINMSIVAGNSEIAAVPVNLTSISGTIYTSDVPIVMLAGYYFIISCNGSLDYYISTTSL